MSCSESRTVTKSTGTVRETLARNHCSTSAPSSLTQRLISVSWSGSSSSMAIRTGGRPLSLTVNDTAMAESSPPPQESPLRIALLGAGTIARLVLDHARRGELAGVSVIAIAGRQGSARADALARDFGIPLVLGRESLFATRPEVVLEAASHDAVREHLVALLDSGISVVVMSAGALADDSLRIEAERAAKRGGARLMS